MSTSSKKPTDDSDTYIDWLEKAVSENFIKYYDYSEFIIKEIDSESIGNIFRANWKGTNTLFFLKSSNNLTIKEIINEVIILRNQTDDALN